MKKRFKIEGYSFNLKKKSVGSITRMKYSFTKEKLQP